MEAGIDWVAAGKYPGQFGAGLWYQTGLLRGPPGISENGTGGFYLFGGQRIWGRSAGNPASDGKDNIVIPASEREQNASISTFVQFGINNSETLPVKEYLGLGFTGFGLVPHRPGDSIGVGMAWSWLAVEDIPRSWHVVDLIRRCVTSGSRLSRDSSGS